jgi:hypothetical protein
MKNKNTYLRKLGKVGRIYPKVIGNTVQDKTQSTSTLCLNNQSIHLGE